MAGFIRHYYLKSPLDCHVLFCGFPMKCSLNEIELNCRKAAKGCGLPWGVADEAGKAVRWLHAFGLDAVTGYASLLGQYDHRNHLDYAPISLEGIWLARSEILSPIMTGISLCDCLKMMTQQPIKTADIAWPLLAAGFLGQAALTKEHAVRISWSDVSLVLSRDELHVSGKPEDLNAASASSLTCERLSATGDSELADSGASLDLHIGDAAVDETAWVQLSEYAHRTYVEATEASRLSGAGAGLNDND
jgi:hypothetical protein